MAQVAPKKDLEKELEEKLSSIQVGKVEEEARATAQKAGLSYVNLKSFPVDANAVLILDEKDARSGQMVVISKTGQNLKIAVVNPSDPQTETILGKLKGQGYTYGLVITSPLGLEVGWLRYREKKDRTTTPPGIVELNAEVLSDIEKQIKNIADLKERLTSLPITKVLDILIAGALKIKASDVHFEPEEKVIRLRYRLDGVLN